MGGLWFPSEVLSLRWDRIDGERWRTRVDSPTEHHPGGAFRIVPIFPELRPYLEAFWEAAEPGAVHVVPGRFRQAALKAEVWKAVNLRTTFEKVIRGAGVAPWPKLFLNLRSGRETELVGRFPLYVVTRWLENTPRVADKHYLQVTVEHYAAALREVTQNPAQQIREGGCIFPKFAQSH